jgi:outer membrane protein TolC
VGLGLTWDIFDGGKSYAHDGEATAQRLLAEAILREKQLRAVQDTQFWRNRLNYFAALFEAKKSEIEKARESVRLAREGRSAGIRTNTDLLDAELDLFKAEAGKVNAQVGVLEAVLQLELSTGTELHTWL